MEDWWWLFLVAFFYLEMRFRGISTQISDLRMALRDLEKKLTGEDQDPHL